MAINGSVQYNDGFLPDIITADSRTGCAAANAQAAGAGMEGRHPVRSRDQHGDGRETSSLEAAES